MKTIFATLSAIAVSILLAVSFGHTSNAAGPHSNCGSDACSITDMSTGVVSNAGSDDERTLSLTCPNCSKLMWATFKIGCGSTTIAKCEKCYSRFAIRYNWPRDHSEPTIFEIKKM